MIKISSIIKKINLRWTTRKENLRNRKDTRRKSLYFKKLNPETRELIEIIDYKDLSPRMVETISASIRENCKSGGFIWERGDHRVDNYILLYGYPEEKDWIELKRFPGVYCNKNGMLKVNGALTVGFEDRYCYRKISIDRKPYFIHRLIFEAFNGEISESNVIDHISGERGDNRLQNLRSVSQRENMENVVTIKKFSKPVKQYTKDGIFLNEYISLREATRKMKGDENYRETDNTIQLCCTGKGYTGFGYLWCFSGEESKIPEAVERLNNRYNSPVFFKYTGSGILVETFPSISKICEKSGYSFRLIKKRIESGKLAPDGFYYSRGPRNFDNENE